MVWATVLSVPCFALVIFIWSLVSSFQGPKREDGGRDPQDTGLTVLSFLPLSIGSLFLSVIYLRRQYIARTTAIIEVHNNNSSSSNILLDNDIQHRENSFWLPRDHPAKITNRPDFYFTSFGFLACLWHLERQPRHVLRLVWTHARSCGVHGLVARILCESVFDRTCGIDCRLRYIRYGMDYIHMSFYPPTPVKKEN